MRRAVGVRWSLGEAEAISRGPSLSLILLTLKAALFHRSVGMTTRSESGSPTSSSSGIRGGTTCVTLTEPQPGATLALMTPRPCPVEAHKMSS